MTILASLARAYDRLPDAPPFGYALAKIGFLISLNEDGSVAQLIDLRTGEGSKRQPRALAVPQPPKKSAGIICSFLWDKTAYVLGITAGQGKRLDREHAYFREYHLAALEKSEDIGLIAFRFFLKSWTPDQFISLGWPEDLKDQNVVFALESDRRPDNTFLHDRDAAKTLWASMQAAASGEAEVCLVRGARLPVARLHPSIKGVWGGQSSGGSIVAFNATAYESYGHDQGGNAPVSESATFAYTTALNIFLAKGSRNRIQIGDASTVFWADASDVETAETAQEIWLAGFSGIDETQQSERVRAVLEGLRNGRPLGELDPKLETGVRFYVLGLAPNAARISIRFWHESDFAGLARNYQRFAADMQIEPQTRTPFPPLWQYLAETAVLGKRENVPPKLAGEWMRAILTGNRYPLTLLTSVLMRIRADREVNALRAGMLKAVLIRNFERKETPVALDPDFKDKGYLLGRLFAVYERIQEAALGGNINATIKDKFYGSASAQPRKVFSAIDRNAANHLSKVAKRKPSYKVTLERALSAIMENLSPADDPFPASLSAQEQALFGLGYYHQRSTFFQSRETEAPEIAQ
ncbi:MAG: type I-C CRISPR-associated protein Cas8c/Csd1 [Hyphomonas sp.]|nr:type I-C CRISPR-associated protein Cas8c/Csd1 [Hyphomonas sp.]